MILEYTKWIGKQRFHFAEIDSTNKKIKELAVMGGIHGTLVTADTQTAGTGRRGRSWASEKNAGIYMSLLLRPQLKPEQAPMLTLTAALSVVNAVSEILKRNGLKASPRIKWPNDIVLNGRKICGILTEMILNQGKIDFVVVGIGINVANRHFPEEIKETASSIYLETGLEVEKEQLTERVCELFEGYYADLLQAGDFSVLKPEYESFLVNKDREVNVLDPQGAFTGMAKGITNTGELLVDTKTGVQAVSGGEVSVRGIYGYV